MNAQLKTCIRLVPLDKFHLEQGTRGDLTTDLSGADFRRIATPAQRPATGTGQG